MFAPDELRVSFLRLMRCVVCLVSVLLRLLASCGVVQVSPCCIHSLAHHLLIHRPPQLLPQAPRRQNVASLALQYAMQKALTSYNRDAARHAALDERQAPCELDRDQLTVRQKPSRRWRVWCGGGAERGERYMAIPSHGARTSTYDAHKMSCVGNTSVLYHHTCTTSVLYHHTCCLCCCSGCR